MKFLAIMSALFFAMASVTQAEVIFDDGVNTSTLSVENGTKTLTIEGPILEDYIDILVFSLNKAKPDVVVPISEGGEFFVGLIAGDLISNYDVVLKGECASSCAFMVLAANSITFDGGELLFHLPYIESAPTDLSLNELFNEHASVIILASDYVNHYGFEIELLYDISQTTTIDTLMTIDNVQHLEYYRKSE